MLPSPHVTLWHISAYAKSPGEHRSQVAGLAWTERGRLFRCEEVREGYVWNLENHDQLRQWEHEIHNTIQIA